MTGSIASFTAQSDMSAEEVFTKQHASTTGGAAPRYVTFLQSQSEAVKRNDPAGCRGGHYLVNGKAYEQLHVAVGPTRPKAIHWPYGASKLAESYDPLSETFKEISNHARKRADGASVGLEYLVWIYEAQAFGILTFKGNAFNRGNHKPLGEARAKGQVAVLGGEFVDEKPSWHNMCVLDAVDSADLEDPSDAQAESAVQFFKNPPAEQRYSS